MENFWQTTARLSSGRSQTFRAVDEPTARAEARIILETFGSAIESISVTPIEEN